MSFLDTLLQGVKSIASGSTALPQRPQLVFTGAGVVVSDSSSTNQTVVSIDAAGGASQYNTTLANGLNSNVAVPNPSSIRFGGYTGPVILGGILPTIPPTPGQLYQINFTVSGQPVTIRNNDAASTSTNRILTGTGSDVLLPPGQTPKCYLQWDGTANCYTLQSSGVHQVREYNVLDWGFDPTGSTANDTAIAALAASITASLGSAATASGGTARIFFPYGTYLFANTWPSFPNTGVIFEGSGFGITSTLAYSGTGTFIAAPSSSQFKNLRIIATTTTNSGSPSMANVIQSLSSGTGAVYVVTTYTNHGYVTGDLVGIYGTGTTADCDPALPWTITVLSPTTYSLNGSTFVSGYAPATHTVNAASDAVGGPSNPIVVGTTTAHGLLNGQLCYISGVGGNTAANGLQRVFGIPGNTSSIPIAQNLFSPPPQAGSGTYTSGGTVFSGGCCLLYSRIAFIGIAVQGTGFGNCHFERCFFENWKYALSFDGAELCWADQCYFLTSGNIEGYTCDMLNNDGAHSSAAVRIGGFINPTGDVANVNGLFECNFENYYAGVYHHDGYGHYVTRCNFENPVVALIGSSIDVIYRECANDGSSDQVGIFQVVGTNAGPIALYDCLFSSSGCPCISTATEQSVNGITLSNLTFNSTFPAMSCPAEPFVWSGFNNSYSGPIGNVVALENAASGQNIFNGGKTINHSYPSEGALDIGYFNQLGTSPASFPGIIIRNPATQGFNTVFYAKTWFPANVIFDGYTTDVTDVPGPYAGNTYSRHADGLGYAGLTPSSGKAIANTPLITNIYSAGEITMRVVALNTTTGLMSTWKIRQNYSSNGGAATLGAILETETNDAIGLTLPTMSLSGSAGTQVVVSNVYNSSANNTFFTAEFELNGVGP